ncbi:hypothetical protein BT96DRAFT_928974 [Gymnopus androsaceus JB14]|uniref:Uncharacterized protein n=1 Tax=Gymnopus androsaceus JB14 TaxID=1447944 RepID=A0A6A4GHW0_9AGAR|nr:hypothetical protein BT96DRAFT_930002 [Gymnopus androsaceus JB14]KAE9385068.1 hypothetical protein BT96DRAFT_928974 [Gymnopus androsaceus JB14]
MISQEQEDIFILAQNLTGFVVALIVQFIGYGMLMLGMGIAFHSLRERPWGHSRIIVVVCLIGTLVCSTWNGICQGMFTLEDVRYQFIRTLEGGLLAQVQASLQEALITTYMQSWPVTIMLLLSDFMVTWRAWVLFQDKKLWRFGLAFFMIANIGINIADCIWADVEATVENTSITILDSLSSMISLFINIFATLLIAWRAWNHHRILKQASIQHRTPVQSILLLLIESGAMFCAVQVSLGVVLLLETYTIGRDFTLLMGGNVMISVSAIASALYPVAVIILVSKDKSPIIETLNYTQSTVTGC